MTRQHHDPGARALERPRPGGRPAGLESMASAIGNRAMTRLLSREPLKGAVPPGPAEGTKEVDPGSLVDEILRDKVDKLSLLACSTYLDAVGAVRTEVQMRQAAVNKASDDLWSMAVSVGLALVPTQALFATAMRATVVAELEAVLKQRAAQDIASGKPWGAAETVLHDWLPKVTDAHLQAAYGATTPLLGLMKGTVQGRTVHERSLSLLEQCAASASAKTRAVLVAAQLSREQMLALWAAFSQGDLRAIFIGHLSALTKHFEAQVAPKGLQPRLFHARVPAYGRDRWALLRRPNISDPLLPPTKAQFVEWITPDLEAMVAAANPTAEVWGPTDIEGHLPNPVTETERRMWINAWGRKRLALVFGEGGKTYLIRWFDATEYVREQAAAEAQDGGLREIGAAEVQGLRKPVDA